MTLRMFGEVFGRMDGALSKSGVDPAIAKGVDSSTNGIIESGGSVRLRSLRQRAAKFEALSRLFDLDLTSYRRAIEQLRIPCGDVASCALQTSGVRPAADAALAWVDNVANKETVQAEHIRLFGGADPSRQMPYVSPFASTYDSLAHDSAVASVVGVYDECGFVPTCRAGRACPTHISNELEFVSFLLNGAADGNDACEQAAHLFVTDHLSAWAVLFSAAVHSRSEHPVTQFAGLALEHLLLCERERALFDAFVGNTPS